MCFNANIETVMEQVETARTTGELRRLLEAADACGSCPESGREDSRPSDCFCRQNQQLKLKNLITYTMEGPEWM